MFTCLFVLVAATAADSSSGVQEGCPASERVPTPFRRRSQDFKYRCTGDGKGDGAMDAFICHLASPKTTRAVHTHIYADTHAYSYSHIHTVGSRNKAMIVLSEGVLCEKSLGTGIKPHMPMCLPSQNEHGAHPWQQEGTRGNEQEGLVTLARSGVEGGAVASAAARGVSATWAGRQDPTREAV